MTGTGGRPTQAVTSAVVRRQRPGEGGCGRP